MSAWSDYGFLGSLHADMTLIFLIFHPLNLTNIKLGSLVVSLGVTRYYVLQNVNIETWPSL